CRTGRLRSGFRGWRRAGAGCFCPTARPGGRGVRPQRGYAHARSHPVQLPGDHAKAANDAANATGEGAVGASHEVLLPPPWTVQPPPKERSKPTEQPTTNNTNTPELTASIR